MYKSSKYKLQVKRLITLRKAIFKIPTQSSRSFSTDISASFDQPSIEGNNYQMTIMDNLTYLYGFTI